MKVLHHRLASEIMAITPSGFVDAAIKFSYDVPAGQRCKKGEDIFGNKTLSTDLRDGVAIVRASGTFISNAGWLEQICGAISQQDLVAAISDAQGNKPKAIVIDWNTPGGTSAATPEAAAQIGAIGKSVPIYSYVESAMLASAGYWMACCSSRGIFATESSMVGSIGCLTQTVSLAELLKSAGIDARVFSSAPLKATGHNLIPMSEAGASYMQATVDSIGNDFIATVKKNRPGVKAEAFDGRVFGAKQAKQLGLIDGIVSNLSEVVAMAGGSVSGSNAARSQFDFKPIPGRPGQSAVHTAASLAKAIGATVDEAETIITSGKMHIMKSQGDRFMFEISAINKLSKRN
jgi:signal peptide peptidase SppA